MNNNNGQRVADAIMKHITLRGDWPLTSAYLRLCPIMAIRTDAEGEAYVLVMVVRLPTELRTIRYYYRHNTREIYGCNANNDAAIYKTKIPIEEFVYSLALCKYLDFTEDYFASQGANARATMRMKGVNWLELMEVTEKGLRERAGLHAIFAQYFIRGYKDEYMMSTLTNIIARQKRALADFDKVTESIPNVLAALDVLALPVRWEIEPMLSQIYCYLDE